MGIKPYPRVPPSQEAWWRALSRCQWKVWECEVFATKLFYRFQHSVLPPPPNSEQLRQRPAPVLTQIPASQGRRSALSLSDLRARTKASAEVLWVQQGGAAPLEVGGVPGAPAKVLSPWVLTASPW